MENIMPQIPLMLVSVPVDTAVSHFSHRHFVNNITTMALWQSMRISFHGLQMFQKALKQEIHRYSVTLETDVTEMRAHDKTELPSG